MLSNPRIVHEIGLFERRLSGDAGARLRAVLDRQMTTALCDPSEFYELNENDCLVLDEQGLPRLRKSISREQLLAISEVSVSDKGPTFKVDIAGAQKALRDFYDDRPSRPRTVRLEGPAGGAVEVVHGLAERLNAAKERLKQNELFVPLSGWKSATG